MSDAVMAIPVWDNPQVSGGAKASILLVYREAKGYDASGAISVALGKLAFESATTSRASGTRVNNRKTDTR